VTALASTIDPEKDRIAVDGKAVKPMALTAGAKGAEAPLVYWMMNKPAGFATERSSDGESI
jgi:16S rRNA U516 pseudouridylate synthase RsuA-like enzyme